MGRVSFGERTTAQAVAVREERLRSAPGEDVVLPVADPAPVGVRRISPGVVEPPRACALDDAHPPREERRRVRDDVDHSIETPPRGVPRPAHADVPAGVERVGVVAVDRALNHAEVHAASVRGAGTGGLSEDLEARSHVHGSRGPDRERGDPLLNPSFFFANEAQTSLELYQRYAPFFSDLDFVVNSILRYCQKNGLDVVTKELFFTKMSRVFDLYTNKTGKSIDEYRENIVKKLAGTSFDQLSQMAEEELKKEEEAKRLAEEKRKAEELRIKTDGGGCPQKSGRRSKN